jgi:hypothetical protein
MSRSGKKTSVTVEYQRSYAESDRGSPGNREAKPKQAVLFHVDSAPNVTTIANIGNGDSPKDSPKVLSPR